MVNVSAAALGGNQSPVLMGLTGLAQGLSAGYVQGHQLAQQDRVIELQKEASQRAAQELGMRQKQFDFQERQRTAMGKASEIVASLGDEKGANDFVSQQQAAAPGFEQNPEDLRAEYKAQHMHMLGETMKDIAPEYQEHLWGMAEKEANEAESMFQRNHEADKFARETADPMGPTRIRTADGQEHPLPFYIQNQLDDINNDLKNKAVDLDTIRARKNNVYAQIGALTAKENTKFYISQKATEDIMANPNMSPAVRQRAFADVEALKRDGLDPQTFQQRMDGYQQNKVQIDTPNGPMMIDPQQERFWQGLSSQAKSSQLESEHWKNQYLKSEARWRDAEAANQAAKAAGGGSASGAITDKVKAAQVQGAYNRIKAQDDKMRANVSMRVLSNYEPKTEQQMRQEAFAEVQGNLQSVQMLDGSGGVGFPLVQPEEDNAGQLNSALQDMLMGKK